MTVIIKRPTSTLEVVVNDKTHNVWLREGRFCLRYRSTDLQAPTLADLREDIAALDEDALFKAEERKERKAREEKKKADTSPVRAYLLNGLPVTVRGLDARSKYGRKYLTTDASGEKGYEYGHGLLSLTESEHAEFQALLAARDAVVAFPAASSYQIRSALTGNVEIGYDAEREVFFADVNGTRLEDAVAHPLERRIFALLARTAYPFTHDDDGVLASEGNESYLFQTAEAATRHLHAEIQRKKADEAVADFVKAHPFTWEG